LSIREPKPRRLTDVRYIGALPGCFALSGRRDPADNEIPVFACRLSSITPFQAVLLSAEPVKVGETVAAHFSAFGLLKCKVARRSDGGFVMDILLTDDERYKLASKIDWQRRVRLEDLPDRREYRRIVPVNPSTSLAMADGSQVPCFVVDISMSGVAVSAATLPPKGTQLKVGSLAGHVVRRLDIGFAVEFDEIQEFSDLERLIAPVAAPAPETEVA
jgi:hypothetical protein